MPDKPVSKDSPLTEEDVGKMVRLRNGEVVGPLCLGISGGGSLRLNGIEPLPRDIVAVIAPEPAPPAPSPCESSEVAALRAELERARKENREQFCFTLADNIGMSRQDSWSALIATAKEHYKQSLNYDEDVSSAESEEAHWKRVANDYKEAIQNQATRIAELEARENRLRECLQVARGMIGAQLDGVHIRNDHNTQSCKWCRWFENSRTVLAETEKTDG